MDIRTRQPVVLLLDDEPNVTAGLKRALHSEPWKILTAATTGGAFDILSRESVDVVVSDERMPGMSGSQFLSAVRKKYPHTIRMILSGQADLEAAVRAINEGEVYRFLLKPCNPADLRITIRQAMEHKQLVELSKKLLREYEKKQTLLDELERANPGITLVDTDANGSNCMDDEDAEMATDLADLLREMQAQVG
ncbi:MAG: response regulator [Chromatiales bacterium]|nr:response regulator [Chromatiales bacterium]